MGLKEAKEITNTFINNVGIEVKTFELKEAISTVLQEIEHLQKENEELWREYWKNNICVEDSQDLLKEERLYGTK